MIEIIECCISAWNNWLYYDHVYWYIVCVIDSTWYISWYISDPGDWGALTISGVVGCCSPTTHFDPIFFSESATHFDPIFMQVAHLTPFFFLLCHGPSYLGDSLSLLWFEWSFQTNKEDGEWPCNLLWPQGYGSLWPLLTGDVAHFHPIFWSLPLTLTPFFTLHGSGWVVFSPVSTSIATKILG